MIIYSFLFILLIFVLYYFYKQINREGFGRFSQQMKGGVGSKYNCSPTKCSGNRDNVTKSCSNVQNETTCNNSKMSTGQHCSWINGKTNPMNGACEKYKNSVGGVCGSCFN
jgi:hypothetical protein